MTAPERFAEWLNSYRNVDRFGHAYAYHPRSNAHSIALCTLILEDLLDRCPSLRIQGAQGSTGYGINVPYVWPGGKPKTIDLALGRPLALASDPGRVPGIRHVARFAEVYFSCEAKSVMTEHGKSKPRLFDELNSSHEIVHHGRKEAIAAGVTVVNIAPTFVSPMRNQTAAVSLRTSVHRQPAVAEKMIGHLRDLQIRENIADVGFDAYCTIVVDCDNQTYARICTSHPAPQPNDPDHYETFLARFARLYSERFGGIVSEGDDTL